MAPWQSGYAADCKSVDLGSTPGGASILQINQLNAGFFVSKIPVFSLFYLDTNLNTLLG